VFGSKKVKQSTRATRANLPTEGSIETVLHSVANYTNIALVKKQVLDVIGSFESLKARSDRYPAANDELTLCLKGTLPVPYLGSTYNIPVTLWMCKTYPLEAPNAYVTPTDCMRLSQDSPVIDREGRICLDYLREWNPQSSDLITLVQILIMSFSTHPPVYSVAGGGGATRPPAAEIGQDQLRNSLETAVQESIRRSLAHEVESKHVEMDSLMVINSELEEGRLRLPAILDSLAVETAKTDSFCRSLRSDIAATVDVLAGIPEVKSELNPDVDVSPATRLHRQIAECHAQELATGDAIYWLGEALKKGRIGCDDYLKSVRDLSRKQFYLHLVIQEARTKAGLI